MARTYRAMPKWLGDEVDMELLAASLAWALRNRGKTIHRRELARERRRKGDRRYDRYSPASDM